MLTTGIQHISLDEILKYPYTTSRVVIAYIRDFKCGVNFDASRVTALSSLELKPSRLKRISAVRAGLDLPLR